MSSQQTGHHAGHCGLDCSAGMIPPLTESFLPWSSRPRALRVRPGVSDTCSLGCCLVEPLSGGPTGWPGGDDAHSTGGR